MFLELDLRMLLYFFQKIIRYIVKIMFELLCILQNWSFSPNCAIMRFFRWLCNRMQQEVNCAKSHQRIISESLCTCTFIFRNERNWIKKSAGVSEKLVSPGLPGLLAATCTHLIGKLREYSLKLIHTKIHCEVWDCRQITTSYSLHARKFGKENWLKIVLIVFSHAQDSINTEWAPWDVQGLSWAHPQMRKSREVTYRTLFCVIWNIVCK